MVAKGALKINICFLWHPVVACLFFLLFSSFECMLSVAIVVEGRAECPKLALAMKSRAGGTRWVFRGPWPPNFYQWGGPLIFLCHWWTGRMSQAGLGNEVQGQRNWEDFQWGYNPPNFWLWWGPLIRFFTLVFYQIELVEPWKKGPFLILPCSIARNS